MYKVTEKHLKTQNLKNQRKHITTQKSFVTKIVYAKTLTPGDFQNHNQDKNGQIDKIRWVLEHLPR